MFTRNALPGVGSLLVQKHVRTAERGVSGIFSFSAGASSLVQGLVDQHIGGVHREESANLLVFMAYFLRGGIIVEKLCRRADTLLADESELDLGQAITGIDEMPRTAPALEVPPGGEEKRRREMLRRIDNEERALIDPDDGGEEQGDIGQSEFVRLMQDLNASYRLMQIVGQVLRAFPGVLNGEVKTRLTAAAVDMALRVGQKLVAVTREAKNDFVAAYVDRVREMYPHAQYVNAKAAGEANLYDLLRMGLFNVMRHTSHCIGVEDLKRVHEVVLGRVGQRVSRDLLKIAMELDYYGEFPRAKIVSVAEEVGRRDVALARDLLVGLVWQHLYIYRVEHDAKQAVCAKLGISIRPRMLLADEK